MASAKLMRLKAKKNRAFNRVLNKVNKRNMMSRKMMALDKSIRMSKEEFLKISDEFEKEKVKEGFAPEMER